MSSRQLRKLQQQKERQRAQEVDSEQSDDNVDEPAQIETKPRPNIFAALGGEDGSEAEEQEHDEDEPNDNESSLMEQNEATATASNTNKSKKKKKKKNKKPKAEPANESTSAQAQGNEHEDEDEDEIDKAIKELRLSSKAANGDSSHDGNDESRLKGPLKQLNDLLAINPYHLRAINEMRNLFGREVIESANAEEQQQEQGRRRRQQIPQQVDLETFLREPPGAKKLPEVSLRRNIFVQGKDHWPRQSAGGLTMKDMGKSADGLSTEYAYVHDKNYDAIQAVFFAYVQVGDPMRMVHLLKEVPYHVSTLLQVSSVAKQDQNMALAAELCERALFTFGRVTTSAFRQDIEHGRARLDFCRPENRQFWLAGYHYLRSLIRKGTYRTALEWAKLLYALDPKDPYTMRHYIPFLALRAYESKWLIDFMHQADLIGHHGDIIYTRQNLVLAKLQANDKDGAREALLEGVKRVPWLYCALFQELNLDAPPSIWGINADSDTRSFWVKLYIHQNKDLWNNPQAIDLLQAVTKSIDGRVDVAPLPQDPDVDLGTARLAYLEGQTSLLAVTPRNLLDSQPNYEFDPLPPPESDNIFSAEGTQLPWRDERRGPLADGGRADELMARMQNLLARQGGPAPRGAMMGMAGAENDDDDDDDEDLLALRVADDEELQRDIAAHVNWSNEPGILGTMLQMLGIGRPATDDEPAGGDEEGGASEDEVDVHPGAWPEEHSPR